MQTSLNRVERAVGAGWPRCRAAPRRARQGDTRALRAAGLECWGLLADRPRLSPGVGQAAVSSPSAKEAVPVPTQRAALTASAPQAGRHPGPPEPPLGCVHRSSLGRPDGSDCGSATEGADTSHARHLHQGHPSEEVLDKRGHHLHPELHLPAGLLEGGCRDHTRPQVEPLLLLVELLLQGTALGHDGNLGLQVPVH